MARTPVIRDTSHPDFPHGTTKGRARNCGCTPCREAKNAQARRNRRDSAVRGPARCVSPEMGQRVHDHVDWLLREVPEASLDLIGTTAGVGSVPYIHFKQGRRGLSRRVATAILALTPTKVRAAAKLVPAQPVKDRVRRLQSLGYPLAWMKRKSGVHLNDLVNRDQERVEIRIADAVDALEELTEWRPADPIRDGINERAISRAKHAAREVGYGDYTPKQLERILLDVEPTRRMIRSMQALGYSLAWQNRQLNARTDQIVLYPEGGKITPHVHEKVAALAARIGDRRADPDRDGLHRGAITYASNAARRAGYYPPAFYDEDGTLDWRSIPDHPWSVFGEHCHDLIAGLERALRNPDMGGRQLTGLTHGKEPAEGSREHGIWATVERRNTRMLKRLGIRQVEADATARRDALNEALWKFHRGQGDPVSFCIETGLLDPSATAIPNDYPSPALVEAREKAAEEREEKAERLRAAKRTPEYRARANELRRNKAEADVREQVAA